MESLALIILVICSILGFGAIFFTTFGTLIILIGSFLYAALTNFSILNVQALLILVVLYLFGEVLEYIFIVAGAKKLGASNMAVVGALIGGTLGALVGTLFLGIGLFLSTLLGVFLGAFLVELIIQRDLIKSAKAAAGGVIGRILSIGAKAIIAFFMFFVIYYCFTHNTQQVFTPTPESHVPALSARQA
ncbi:MAG: DUF456 domain-containing protein [Candidatus Omnitrophica bacterium]|nr:DUF456 domain-containing protein [Candidatus Omnitrophota bacterium]